MIYETNLTERDNEFIDALFEHIDNNSVKSKEEIKMKTTVKVVVTKYYKKVGWKIKAPKTVTLTINNPDDWKTIVDAANARLHDDTINALTLHFVKEVETL